LLDSQYEALLARWAARAAARQPQAPALGEHLPALLRGLIADFGTPELEDAAPASYTAPQPEIFRQAFDLEAVVYEYGLLQRIVLELLESASVPVSMRDVRRLGDWFTRAVAAAAVAHAKLGGGKARSEGVDSRPSAEQDTQRSPGQDRAQPPQSSQRTAQSFARAAGGLDESAMMQAPVAVSVMRCPDFVYEFANPLARAMAGDRDVLGKSVRQAFPELDESAPVFHLLEQVYASGEAFSTEEYRVSLDRHGDGVIEDVYFHFTCQPIRDESGQVRSLMTVATDVSQQVYARRRIEALMQELTLQNQRKDEFLAMLGHELRNPIAAISTALTLLDRAGGDEASSVRYRETARRQMSSLVRLVDDLLDVARITRGKVQLKRAPTDLGAIVQHALSATRSVIEARGHELSVTFASGAFRVLADATRIEQVVVNLLTNAAKYTDPGGSIGVRLTHDEQAAHPTAVLSVRDTGRGIPPDMLDRVFELFTQVSPGIDRSTGGLGLGLTLVKHLVEMHGGSVSALSTGLGQGSEFAIRLPLWNDPLAATAAGPEPPKQAADVDRRRVVLVEDSDDVRELLKECIEQLGHEVLVAEDGVLGVDLIAREWPDVALVDVGLPGIDGYEVARRVRAQVRGQGVRLIALTGYGGEDVAKAARAAGFDEHVTKPIDMDRLRDVLALPPRAQLTE
jgi:signal transduction histidine kinase/ActR/RegA family two-component response regulator